MTMTVAADKLASDNIVTAPPIQPLLSSRAVHRLTADKRWSALLARPVATEIRRLNPSARRIRIFETSGARVELLEFAEHVSAEFEVLMPCHVAILLPDGISEGFEWSNGRRTQKFHSLPSNTVMFNPAEEYLRIRTGASQNHCRVLMLTIDPNTMNRVNDHDVDTANVRFQQLISLDDQAACQALVAIQLEIENPGSHAAFYIDTLLMLLLTRLMRCASNLARVRQTAYAKGGLSSWRLRRALELLEGDPAEAPSLVELAHALRLHPTSFCRAFKQSTGLSPHRYLLVHRVNRAKEMMRDQERSLTAVALDCGFSDSSQFSVVFKRITGLSPREYRRSL